MSAALEAQVVDAPIVINPPQMLPLTAERKVICLDTLIRTGGNVTKAARLIGTTKQNIYRWVQTDPVFADLFQEALDAGTDNLEEKAYDRAMDTSDRMMELLLRARRPDKYRESYKPDAELTLADSDIDRLGQSIMNACLEAARRRQAALPAGDTPSSE